jgi:hypothetical protein
MTSSIALMRIEFELTPEEVSLLRHVVLAGSKEALELFEAALKRSDLRGSEFYSSMVRISHRLLEELDQTKS